LRNSKRDQTKVKPSHRSGKVDPRITRTSLIYFLIPGHSRDWRTDFHLLNFRCAVEV
jgi:hypothetical protein